MSALPVVTAPRALRTPAVAETVLDSGLRVLAVRKAGVPLAELRLRIPLPCAGAALGERQDAVLTVLTETLLEGTVRGPGHGWWRTCGVSGEPWPPPPTPTRW
jgi:zinc protease